MSGEWLKPEDMRTVGDRVRFFRLSQSPCGTKPPWTRKELAAKAGCADCTIRNIEDELRSISEASLRAVCGALGVRMSMLAQQDKFLECVRVLGLKAPGKAPSTRKIEPESKQCERCDTTFRRLSDVSKAEWNKRRFCSQRCGAVNRWEAVRKEKKGGVA